MKDGITEADTGWGRVGGGENTPGVEATAIVLKSGGKVRGAVGGGRRLLLCTASCLTNWKYKRSTGRKKMKNRVGGQCGRLSESVGWASNWLLFQAVGDGCVAEFAGFQFGGQWRDAEVALGPRRA